MNVVHHFFIQNQQDLNLLNQAFIMLVPKKNHPHRVSDFRPISLTHSFFFKIISKILATRLGPELEHLVSYNQTAFIKERCINDSFLYVQEVIKSLHKRRTPTLFTKLDISMVFDIVSWPYLLSILQHTLRLDKPGEIRSLLCGAQNLFFSFT
jgi:hypothetical protein